MAQAMHNKRRIFFAMIESTPGTYVGDSSLFVAANAQLMQPKNIKGAPTVNKVARDPDGISLQPIASVHGAASFSVTMESVLFTSGAAGTAPPFGLLLRSCFMKETVVAVTSVTYTKDPNSTTTMSCGIAILQEDGSVNVQWAMAGVRGNAIFKAGKIGDPMAIDWTFTGKQAITAGVVLPNPVQAAISALTFTNEVTNVVKYWQFKGSPTGIFARQVNNMTLDLGTAVELTTDTVDESGYGYCILSKDAPTLKTDPAKVPKAVIDDVTNYLSGTTFASTVTLGATAGKIFAISAPNCQIDSLTDATRNNVSTWDGTMILCRTPTAAVSDALSLIFT